MKNLRGQSILEYIILIGIVGVALFYMGMALKRGAQSMVKVTADQIGSQKDADQSFDGGFLLESTSDVKYSTNKDLRQKALPISNTEKKFMAYADINESTESTTQTITNGGFAPGN